MYSLINRGRAAPHIMKILERLGENITFNIPSNILNRIFPYYSSEACCSARTNYASLSTLCQFMIISEITKKRGERDEAKSENKNLICFGNEP